MFNFFANAFGYVLNFFYNIFNNYGVSIIIFTILLKLIMVPISIKQQKTLKKSTKIQAKSKELQEKYASDQVRLSQELMNLYKEENMSPFSGCLSSIVQIIIIISMFYLVRSPLTYMKHIEPEIINTYIQELQEEGMNSGYQEIAVIKAKSAEDERVRINMNFLGLDLSDVPTQDYTDFRVFIIPVLYVITSIVSMKMTTKMTAKMNDELKDQKNVTETGKTEEDKKDEEIDAVEQMSKNMNLLMPVMSVSIALIAPLGLALYWLVNNLLMMLERVIINKFFKEKEGEING